MPQELNDKKLEDLHLMMMKLLQKIEVMQDSIDELHERLGEKPKFNQHVSLKEAWKVLGYSSYDAMLGKIRSGFYRVGVEVFDCRSPGSVRANWKADIEACLQRHRTPAAKRAP